MLIGLGRLGQELLGKISRDLAITCVTNEEDSDEILKRLKREDVELIKGDATSRLVLEGARIEDAEAVVITITTERISREVAMVLKDHFKPRRVISVAVTTETTDMLLKMSFEVDNIFASTATDIRNRIEHKTKAAHAIGIGKNEILEVEVHPHSRLANKPLNIVKPLNWRTGIIYREGNIIIPRGDTVLRPRDRVVILGDPQTLRTVTEIMTFNYQKFPLEYGSSLIVYLSGREDQGFIDELNYLYSTFPFKKAIILRPERASGERFDKLLEGLEIKEPEINKTSLSSMGAIKDAISLSGNTQGLIMLSSSFLDSFYSTLFGAKKRSYIKEVLSACRCPILISKGTAPYEKVALPCVGERVQEHVIETALQLSEEINNRVTTIQVAPSEYISRGSEHEIYDAAKSTISALSMVYKSKVEALELSGNPIKAVHGAVGGHNLLVASLESDELYSVFRYLLTPDVIWGIINRSPISTLVLPSWEEMI